MTKEELAAKINGRTLSRLMSKQEQEEAREAGLVVVYGKNDDTVVFDGALWGQDINVLGGDYFIISKPAEFIPVQCNCCKYDTQMYIKSDCVEPMSVGSSPIDHPNLFFADGYPTSKYYLWAISTNLPSAMFKIERSGRMFGIGVVVSLEDIVKK